MNDTECFRSRVNSIQQLFVYLLVGVGIGLAIMSVSLNICIFAVAGFCALLFVSRKPEAGILIMMLLANSIIFQESIPMIPIGVGSLHLRDIVLIFLLGTIFIQRYISRKSLLIRTPSDVPLILFYMTAILASVIAIYYKELEPGQMIRVLRAITYYSAFFLVTNLIRDRKQFDFIVRGMFGLAAIVATAMIVQALVGDVIQLIPGRVEQARTLGKEFEALRILPPGQALLYFAFVITLSLAAHRQVSLIKTLPLTMLYGSGILLTLNRSYWVALLLTIIIFLFILPYENRKKFLLYLLAIAVTGSIALISFKGTSRVIMENYQSMSNRFVSLFDNNSVLKSRSLEDRYLENHYALKHIIENPVLGIGLGKPYRPSLFGPDDDLSSYIHNGYLWIIMDIGIVGFAFFIWFYAGTTIRGWIHWKRIKDEVMRMEVAGFVLSGIGMSLIAMVNPVFMQLDSILVIALSAGMVETAIRINNHNIGAQNG